MDGDGEPSAFIGAGGAGRAGGPTGLSQNAVFVSVDGAMRDVRPNSTRSDPIAPSGPRRESLRRDLSILGLDPNIAIDQTNL